jgi:hypothetical protein
MLKSDWTKKGATLSDKSVIKEFGLSQDEIIKYINEGKLQDQHNSAHGNPYLKLIRDEVESEINEVHGEKHLTDKKISKQLDDIDKEIKKFKLKLSSLEKNKKKLLEVINKTK